MSHVSRSVYQKLKEENKRLLSDLAILCTAPDSTGAIDIRMKWKKKFNEEREFNLMVREMCMDYMKDNPNDPAVKFVNSLKK